MTLVQFTETLMQLMIAEIVVTLFIIRRIHRDFDRNQFDKTPLHFRG